MLENGGKLTKRGLCIISFLCIVCLFSSCGDTNMHFSKGAEAWHDQCVIDITKGNSTEPVKVAEVVLFIKDGPDEYQNDISGGRRFAYGTKAIITVHGKIVPKSVKRVCYQRDNQSYNSCIYGFDILRGGKKYHIQLPLVGFLSDGHHDIYDVQACWLDYPNKNDVQWVEIQSRWCNYYQRSQCTEDSS